VAKHQHCVPVEQHVAQGQYFFRLQTRNRFALRDVLRVIKAAPCYSCRFAPSSKELPPCGRGKVVGRRGRGRDRGGGVDSGKVNSKGDWSQMIMNKATAACQHNTTLVPG